MTSILQYFIKRIKFNCCLIGFLFYISVTDSYCITAKFSIDLQSRCVPAVVIFTNLSTQGLGITYQWDFGKGATSISSEQVLEEVYSNPGHYIITLTVIKGIERDSVSDTIDISTGPSAKFIVNTTQGCAPLQVNFTNTSTSLNGFKDISWDFRNGDIRKGDNITYVYPDPGNYDVLLSVTDSNDCKSYVESKNLINVFNKPKADFSVTDSFACNPPLNVTFINNSTGQPGLKYLWDFGNGTKSSETNQSVAYTNNGNYNVKLVVADIFNCKDSVTKNSLIKIGKASGNLYAQYDNGHISSNNLLCPGKITFFFSLANQTDYSWKVRYKNITQYFYNDNKFTLQASDSGTVSIKLVYGKHSDCEDSISKTFIIDYIKADFSIDNPFACQLPHNINLQNNSKNAVSYNWNLPNEVISHNTNLSLIIPRYLSFNQIYSHKSIHEVLNYSLTAINSNGCKDSISKNVSIALPVARFMPDKVSGCVPMEVTFSDSSKADAPITKRIYRIGNDSMESLTSNPVKYTFTSPGKYNVMMIIKTDQNCIDTSYNVLISTGEKLKPVFTVSKSSVCYNDTLTLTGSSNLKDSIDSWHYSCAGVFNTGSNKSSDAIIPVRTDSGGIKNIKLEVDYNGCISDTTEKNAFSVVGPLGNFIDTFSCNLPLTYTFVSKISPATSLEWKIDTLTINNKDSATFTFPNHGINYNVKLTAKDNVSHCTLVRNRIIPVRQVKASFMINPFYCFGDSIKFDASSSLDYKKNCYNEGFLWDFNDNSPGRRTYDSLYYYTYNNKGKFHPLLTVFADNGCTDTISKLVTMLRPEPSFTINKNIGCAPKMDIMFTNTSIDSSIASWNWIFGDNTFDNNKLWVIHTYNSISSKDYFTGLEVHDFYGCKNVAAKTVSIVKASAEFQAIDNALCIGDEANFRISSGSIDKFKWYFGDGDTSINSNNHTYNTSGLFDVKLIIQTEGCSDTLTKKQYINVEKANASYALSDSILKCYPATITFNNNGSGSPIVAGTWNFGDGSLSESYSKSPQYTYTRPGNYNTSLWVRTLNNCQASDLKNIVITGPIASFDFTPKIICYGGQVSFHINQTQNVDESRWLFGDGEISTLSSPTHNYFARGIIVPALWLKNSDCETTIVQDSLLVSGVTANFSLLDNKSKICLGQEISAQNQSQHFIASTWELNDIVTSTQNTPADIFPNRTGEYVIKLIVGDNYGCYDSISKNISVVPNPDFHITGDTSICKGKSSAHFTVPSNPNWRIKWTPAIGISDTASFNPMVTPQTSTRYFAFISDTNGCRASDSIFVFVKQASNISYIPKEDTSINIGDRVQLIILTAGDKTTYQWSPNYNISCIFCSNPFVWPETDKTYKVKIKDECFDTIKNFNIHVIINFFLEAPQAFVPNSRVTKNAEFKFESKNIKTFDLKIFNRWGDLIFSSDSPDKGWDGTYNGKQQNIDTYTYYVKAETGSGYKFERKGSFLLLK